MVPKSQILQAAAVLVLMLADRVAADCWSNKCSRLGLASTVSCASACRDKGYSYSGHETYTRLWPPDVWVGEFILS